MNNNQLAEVANILGVSEDSISAMDDEIKNSMTAIFETVAVRNDEDKKDVFEALDKCRAFCYVLRRTEMPLTAELDDYGDKSPKK